MPAHRVAEQFCLGFEPLTSRRLAEQRRILREEIEKRIPTRLKIKFQIAGRPDNAVDRRLGVYAGIMGFLKSRPRGRSAFEGQDPAP